MKLKQYLLASAACGLPFSATAAPPPPPAPFTWTGFYVGGSAGVIGQGTTLTDLGASQTGLGFFAEYPGSTFGITGIGGLFGGDIGYNFQTGSVVFGIEADFAGSTLNNTATFNYFDPANVSSQLHSLGTIRGRVGYAFDRVLLYATGGFAWGNVSNAVNVPTFPLDSASTSGWQTGWTVGGGLEYAMTNNWTVRVEGFYVDLGTTTAISSNPYSTCRFGFKNSYLLGRLGLNYKF